MAEKTKKKNTTFYVNEETIEEMAKISKATGQSRGDIIDNAIRPMVKLAEQEAEKPTILVFTDHKGGSSKTTTSLTTGIILGERGYKVLLIDLDGQGNLTELIDSEEYPTFDPEGIEPCIADVMISGRNGSRMTLAEVLHETEYQNVSIIPSSLAFDNADVRLSMEPSSSIGSRLCFAIEDLLETHPFDYVIIDCPPSLGMRVSNAVTALDAGNPNSFVIIPIKPDGLSTRGTRNTINLINSIAKEQHKRPHKYRVLWTAVNERSIAYKESKKLFDEEFPDVDTFRTEIRLKADVATANTYLTTIFKYDQKSSVIEDFNRLADEIEEYANA